jgi:ATP-dependent protease HslVU (ClpYQ) peptidase subunit
MTCIIGLVEDGKVYMGADSIVTVGWGYDQDRTGKVFHKNGLLIGCAGPTRLGDLLHYHIDIDKKAEGQGSTDYVVSIVAEAIRACAKDRGIASITNNEENSGGAFLVGCYGNLYHIGQSYGVSIHEFWAIGTGGEHAIGAMAALPELPAEQRIMKALEISSSFVHTVKPPFHIEVLE